MRWRNVLFSILEKRYRGVMNDEITMATKHIAINWRDCQKVCTLFRPSCQQLNLPPNKNGKYGDRCEYASIFAISIKPLISQIVLRADNTAIH